MNKFYRRALMMVLIIWLPQLLKSQNIDHQFKPFIRTNPSPYSMIIQSDGKIIIGGDIESYGYKKTSSIIRLNADGSLDASFNVPENNWMSYKMEIDIQDRIYMEKEHNGWNRHIVRINKLGAIDEQFQIDENLDYINQFTVQEAKCIVSTGVWKNDIYEHRIVRLDETGKIDSTFDIFKREASQVTPVAQPNGKLILYGSYSVSNDGIYSEKPFLLRLNQDGSLDETFQFTGEIKGDYPNVYQVIPQQDGKYLVRGHFDFYNNIPAPGLLRLNNDGSLDNSFILPGPTTNAFQSLSSIFQLPSGKYVAVGYDYEYEKGSFKRLIWLNEDGSLNNALKVHEFYAGSMQSGWEYRFIAKDEKLIIGGPFNRVDETSAKGIASFNAQGELITEFTPDLGGRPRVNKAILTQDSEIILAGNFTEIEGTKVNNIAKILADGQVDTNFSKNIGEGPSYSIYSMEEQKNGKILVGGGFREFNGQSKSGIVRLNKDGSLDEKFDEEGRLTDLAVDIFDIEFTDDNSIFLGGHIDHFDNSLKDVIKVDSTGRIDNSFTAQLYSENFSVNALLLSDQHLIVGGSSFDDTGYTFGYIEKLNLDGTADSAFFAKNTVAPYRINTLLDDNNKVLAAGEYVFGHGDRDSNPVMQIDTLNQFVDLYSVGVNGFSNIHEILPATDTSYILAGQFDKINRVSRTGLAMFDLKGRVYNDFLFDLNGEARGVIREDEEHVLVYGSFSQINDFPGFSGIARINITTPRPPSDLLVSVDKAMGIKLQWLDSSDYETGFRIYRQTEDSTAYILIDSVEANVTTYWDQDIDPASTYAYKVVSMGDTLASDFSNTARATTSEISLPNAPSGLSVSLNNGSISLSWEDLSDNEIGFIIERAEGDSFVPVDTVYSTNYNDLQVNIETEYRYQVKAYNVAGESPYSEEVTYIPQLITAIGDEIEVSENAFPNPSSGTFTVKIETQGLQKSDISLYNLEGKVITDLKVEIGKQALKLDLSAYQEGAYFLMVHSKASERIKVFRLIRKNQ